MMHQRVGLVLFLIIIKGISPCPPEISALMFRTGTQGQQVYVFSNTEFWLFDIPTKRAFRKESICKIWPEVPLPFDSAFFYQRHHVDPQTYVGTYRDEILGFRKNHTLFLYPLASEYKERQTLVTKGYFQSEYAPDSFEHLKDVVIYMPRLHNETDHLVGFCSSAGATLCPAAVEGNGTNVTVLRNDPRPNCVYRCTCQTFHALRVACKGLGSYSPPTYVPTNVRTYLYAGSDDRFFHILNITLVNEEALPPREIMRLPLSVVAGFSSKWRFYVLAFAVIVALLSVTFAAYTAITHYRPKTSSEEAKESTMADTTATIGSMNPAKGVKVRQIHFSR